MSHNILMHVYKGFGGEKLKKFISKGIDLKYLFMRRVFVRFVHKEIIAPE